MTCPVTSIVSRYEAGEVSRDAARSAIVQLIAGGSVDLAAATKGLASLEPRAGGFTKGVSVLSSGMIQVVDGGKVEFTGAQALVFVRNLVHVLDTLRKYGAEPVTSDTVTKYRKARKGERATHVQVGREYREARSDEVAQYVVDSYSQYKAGALRIGYSADQADRWREYCSDPEGFVGNCLRGVVIAAK